MRYIALWLMFLLLAISPISSQTSENPIITPINIDQVQELHRIGRGILINAHYSPTGVQIAVTSSIGVWLYDDVSAEPRLLTGHNERLSNSAYSPDGARILSYGGDGHITSVVLVWDAHTGELLFSLDMALHPQGVRDAGFSADGLTIFTQSIRDTIYLWDAQTGEFMGEITEKPNRATSDVFNPVGRYRLQWDENAVSVVNMASDTTEATLTGYGLGYETALFHPNGEQIIAVSQTIANPPNISQEIVILDIETGDIIQTLADGHADSVLTLDISPNGAYLVSGGADNQIHVWDLVTGNRLMTLIGHTDKVNRVRYSPTGRFIISASDDTTARVWDATTGTLQHTLAHDVAVVDAGYTGDERFIATSQLNNYDVGVWIWDTNTMTPIRDDYHQVYGLSFHPTLPMFLKYNRDNIGFYWLQPHSPNFHATYELLGDYTDAQFSPNGLVFVGAGVYRGLLLQTLIPQTPIYLKGHIAVIENVAFSRDGRLILSSSADGTLRIWGVPIS